MYDRVSFVLHFFLLLFNGFEWNKYGFKLCTRPNGAAHEMVYRLKSYIFRYSPKTGILMLLFVFHSNYFCYVFTANFLVANAWAYNNWKISPIKKWFRRRNCRMDDHWRGENRWTIDAHIHLQIARLSPFIDMHLLVYYIVVSISRIVESDKQQ